MYAAARVDQNLSRRDHVAAAVEKLQWLPIIVRVDYKLCLPVHKTLLGHMLAYVEDILLPVANIPAVFTTCIGKW